MAELILHSFSYIQYSNICAKVLRQALKADLRTEAAKRNESHVKFTPWANGKPARMYSTIFMFSNFKRTFHDYLYKN